MSSAPVPPVSVIIPTRGRPAALERCLESLAGLTYPRHQVQVIVVHDGERADVATTHDSDRCPTTTHLTVPHGGPGAARNAGAAAAGGEILAFLDDDCLAAPDWLTRLTRALAEHPDAAVGGRVVNALPQNPYARANHTLLDFLYHYYHEQHRGHLPFFTTNNLAVRRAVFETLGGFDTSFPFASEDRDWCDRCRDAGHPLRYAPEALVHHAQTLTFREFIRQHVRYGEGAWRFHRARARRHHHPFGFESPRFYAAMLSAPYRHGNARPWRQSLLLVLSQAAAAAGFVVASLRPGR